MHISGSVLGLDNTQIAYLEERMRPGQSSAAGFLGKDESLRNVALEDEATLNELGITYRQIADKLNAIILRAKQVHKNAKVSLPKNVIIDDTFRVSGFILATCGFQECPFSFPEDKCGQFRQDFEIENLTNHKKISFSSLLIHLIAEHHFFEGKETSYRLEPRLACEVLDLKPEVDYSRELVKKVVSVWGWWGKNLFKTPCPSEHEKFLQQHAEVMIKIDEQTTAYKINTSGIKEQSDEQLVDEPEKSYLHVVSNNDDWSISRKTTIVAGAVLDLSTILRNGVCVCPLETSIEIEIGANDYVS